ncbi:hypothetical protein NDU88_004883 [Pleurodeles waltl]|uniref:Uncharacterized protein n=1 Tax=Pleurodeles waltl TaxID=8319 RepID=A0AAV7NNL4_PLEWA|nr:hypothetical protein NDU88_004883 [Pleurodeles waltl]
MGCNENEAAPVRLLTNALSDRMSDKPQASCVLEEKGYTPSQELAVNKSLRGKLQQKSLGKNPHLKGVHDLNHLRKPKTSCQAEEAARKTRDPTQAQ